jgi:hypothetical protein
MTALLTTIVLWLSLNFGLPASLDHPAIEIVPPARITALRYKGLAGVVPASDDRKVVAVYDSINRTIYLPQGWTGSSPAELSVLVHEMVHHLQTVAQQKFACPQEREELAYKAQDHWLRLFGRELLQEFELDAMTLLVTTKCLD